MKDKKAFGNFIKTKRIEKNYSQKDLAELLFVTESAVSKWERGVSYPDITLITDLCKVLDVTEHELIQSSHDFEYRKMKNDANKYNKLKKTLFWIFNIGYATALLTCFIVNLAVNHTLSWFFIVLASILCAYSFCPTFTWLVKKFKNLVLLGSTFLSLFILFLVCSIYTKNYWFMMPTLGVLLGYFIIFYPILFSRQKHYLKEDKFKKLSKYFMLSYVFGMFILIVLLLITIYAYHSYNLVLGIIITLGCFLIPILIGFVLLFDGGSKVIKIISFSLVGLISASIIFGLVRSFQVLSTKENKTADINEEFNDIRVDIHTYDLNIYLTEGTVSKAEYSESKHYSVEIKVVNNVLSIKQTDNRKFYDMLFNFGKYEIDLYLTQDMINSLDVTCSTGDIKIKNGFTFENVNVDSSTGDFMCNSSITRDLNVKISTGSIYLNDITVGGNVKCIGSTGDFIFENVNSGSLNIKIGTGDTLLSNVIVTNDFVMVGSTGDLVLDGFDAANIDVKVSTGSVTGTILTDKVFQCNASTGDVVVPKTTTGGICKIKTSTGNIIISYK